MRRYSSVCISIINFINLIVFKGSKSPLTKTSDASCISVLTLTFCPDYRHELRSVLGRIPNTIVTSWKLVYRVWQCFTNHQKKKKFRLSSTFCTYYIMILMGESLWQKNWGKFVPRLKKPEEQMRGTSCLLSMFIQLVKHSGPKLLQNDLDD